MDKYFISLGVIGSVISVAGNLPMLFHIMVTKKAGGQSVIAWFVWLIANTLLLIYASYIQDFVFIALQVLWVFFNVIMIYLITRYRKREKNAATA